MARSTQHRNFRIAGLAGMADLLMLLVTALPARAQTFTVLHTFSGGQSGANPYSGLTMDRAGNLYGTTAFGGLSGSCYDGLGCGIVYKLRPTSSGWILSPIYTFRGNFDGAFPEARVIIGPDGNLYGTTAGGGGGTCSGDYYSGCGTVFKLSPPATACKSTLCPWTETVLYRFTGSTDGANPTFGDLVFDRAGNLYGTAIAGGVLDCTGGEGKGCGIVFKLTPSDGAWTESVLYSFTNSPDGAFPYSGVIFDSTGNLYGTTGGGGTSFDGTVYELTPSGSGWTESVLYSFTNSPGGAYPYGGLIFDSAGNLYGTTFAVYGVVYELTPGSGGWTYNLLDRLPGQSDILCGSYASLLMDAAGDLYGTTCGGLSINGTVFELMPPLVKNWRYVPLHEFTGLSDGDYPIGSVISDANGNLYGTAAYGGGDGNQEGVIFEITP
jgi:uncharacterized repeat protein (TIGR03803 family)